MSAIADLGEAAGQGLVPDGPASLHETMEGLPEFFDTLSARLDELAEFTGGTVGERTSEAVTDMAKHAGAAAEAAREAFAAYTDESSAWR